MADGQFFSLVIISSLFKLLFIKSYHSTDFEVHRNWLAITHSLPVSEWYYEATSEWTLDYPPLFAWFEYLWSSVAQFIDKDMLKITNLNHESINTIVFHRCSVVVSDILLAIAVMRYYKLIIQRNTQLKTSMDNDMMLTLFILIFGNFGLFIVDHIHFQYNGFLFGILLLSITDVIQENIENIMNHFIGDIYIIRRLESCWNSHRCN